MMMTTTTNPAEKYSKLFVFSGGNKAGMEAMDKEKQAQVIYEMSKNSAFFKRACKLDEAAEEKAEHLKKQYNDINASLTQRLLASSQQRLTELEKHRCLDRVCCVLDMDMFYAAVEIRDQPQLKDLPVAVGGAYMISTSNYVARKYGVRAAMPGFIAKKLCPHLVFVEPNFDKYKVVADQIRGIIKRFDPDYHSLSLDEVYFDLTDSARKRFWEKNGVRTKTLQRSETNSESDEDTIDDEFANNGIAIKTNYFVSVEKLREVAVEILQEIRQEIKDITGGLTSSAGMANNFFLAKICADMNKPDGQYELPPNRQAILDFLTSLPTRKVGGIGKVMEKLLCKLDIHTVGDIRSNVHKLIHVFTPVTGDFLLRISMGIAANEGHEHEHREAESIEDSIGRKSIGCERTYTAKGIENMNEIFEKLHELCEHLHNDLVEHQLMGRTVTLKLKDVEFNLYTRSQTHSYPIQSVQDIELIGKQLLHGLMPKKIRLLGINMSKLQPMHQQQGKSTSSSSGPSTSSGSIFHSKMQKSMLEFCKTSPAVSVISSSNTNSDKFIVNREEIEDLIFSHEEEKFEEVEDISNTILDEDEVNDDELQQHDSMLMINVNDKSNEEEKQLEKSFNAYDRLMAAAFGRKIKNKDTHHASKKRPLNNMVAATTEYLCPICSIKVDGDLGSFNHHIDNCLVLGDSDQPMKKTCFGPSIMRRGKEDVITLIDSSQEATQPDDNSSNVPPPLRSSIDFQDMGNDTSDKLEDPQIFVYDNEPFVRKSDYDCLFKKYQELLNMKSK